MMLLDWMMKRITVSRRREPDNVTNSNVRRTHLKKNGVSLPGLINVMLN